MSCRSELSGISILTDYVRAGRADFPHLGFRGFVHSCFRNGKLCVFFDVFGPSDLCSQIATIS